MRCEVWSWEDVWACLTSMRRCNAYAGFRSPARAPPLIARCWELRHNVTAYDASYVALAEALGVPLLTADARLANAPGIRCEVELLT